MREPLKTNGSSPMGFLSTRCTNFSIGAFLGILSSFQWNSITTFSPGTGLVSFSGISRPSLPLQFSNSMATCKWKGSALVTIRLS